MINSRTTQIKAFMATLTSNPGWLDASILLSATKAADPAVTLASGKLLENSGDVTVKSKAAEHPVCSKDIRWSFAVFFQPILTPYLHLDTNTGSQA